MFGQAYSAGMFFDKAIVADNLEINKNSTRSDLVYSFIANDNLYVLSYRVDEDINDWKEVTKWEKDADGTPIWNLKRELMLYRLNETINTWYAASNIVQTDRQFGTEHLVNYDCLLQKGLGDGEVRILKNGCIVMLLCNEYNIDRGNVSDSYIYNSVDIFVPNSDGTFTATRFEPENKKTKQAELAASDTLKIYESGNSIKLEFWDKIICKENENPDGFVIYDSDTGGKKIKIYYKRKFFTLLNFEINDKKVYYSGTYKMTLKQ